MSAERPLPQATASPSQARAIPAFGNLPGRDRVAIVSALAVVTILAWIYLIAAAAAMDSRSPAGMMQIRPWTALDGLLMFLMWAVMMVGMMLPSAAPMTLIYAAVARKAAR